MQEIFHNNLTSTAITFLNSNDYLLPDTYNGTIYRYTNGSLIGPLYDFNISRSGLLGLDSIEKNGTRYVFAYVTESGGSEDGDDISKGINPKCNCLYRFELVGDKLINPKLLLDIPAYLDGPAHAGGVIRIDKNDNIFIMTGSLDAEMKDHIPNLANNEINGTDPDGRSGILVMDYNGEPVYEILGESYPLNLYYAYGIRNGFGMDFDPITGNLWITENGPDIGDEINIVKPGFNSGFDKMYGFWSYGIKDDGKEGYTFSKNPSGLVDFDGKGSYGSPELVWEKSIGIVGLGFLNSDYLGNIYNNSMFVSDFNNRYLYNFKLSEDRNSLDLKDPLKDKIVNSTNTNIDHSEISNNIFATGMGFIVDIKMGPDGFLYLLKMSDGSGTKLYRLISNQ